ncbi:MAG: peptidoglycan D,D-transpeptidase FtsI family protein [Acetivibrionales bacterium]|jgi:penicillin-binding protein 2
MYKDRNKTIFLVFFILFGALILRLFYFQICRGKELSKAASAQRITNYNIERPRGNILDRNSIPFTNRTEKFSIVLKPLYLRDKEKELKQISSILNLDYYKIKRDVESKKEPIILETEQQKKDMIMSLNIQGVSALNSLKRYDEKSIATHLLGYLNKSDQSGQAAIEKYYEDVLSFDRQDSIGVVMDARNHLVQGLGYRLLKHEGENKRLNVKLTLDYHIQKIVEEVMEREHITGAVVVEDVCTGDIVAMASKPDYDQTKVADYLQSPKNELFNRTVASYNVGSIFKIIVTTLIYESGNYYGSDYYCPGYIDVGSNRFKCQSYEKGGHGWLNLKEAFAVSCNPFFIDAGIDIGYSSLIEKARVFGLGEYTGIKEQGISESSGNLPPENAYYSNGDIANISIGQGEIMATPLQVADIVATIANGGIKNRINIVDSIVDDDGNKVRDIRLKEWKRVISKDTADKVKQLMEGVTLFGTGTQASLEEYGGAAGKTGSAETGREDVVHAWFAGYFPKRNPKYSVSVFVENGKSGGGVAAPVFAGIAREIMKRGL